ncbi:SGNH/GDSL hydrolase family protein [Clostridium perfringens]|uniref:SGNH/GDSL hydrolase family protein n=1 Tax=Clostridium perfringens TaxID=1502 RepID=UPI001C8822BD|nr:SGNH/GDSL hydrolase family protein [Clostridium perfringens]
MKEIIVNVDAYNENSIRTVEGDNLSEVYKIYILKNKRRIDLTNKIAVMAYVNEYGNKKSNILALNITNASQGEIELPITNVISSENGVYACQIAIYGENNSLEQTAPFSLIVENNIFSKISNTAINSSDFHILSEAIKTTNAYGEKLKEGTENIELQYADKLHEINSQLKNNTYDKQEVDSKVWGMANMGQDVKEAMTGGSVAVVGKDMVDTINLKNNSVTVQKLNKNIKEVFSLSYRKLENIKWNNGSYIDKQGDKLEFAGFSYAEIKVEEGEEYLIDGTHRWSSVCYLVKNDNGDILIADSAPEDGQIHKVNEEFIIPAGGTTLYINNYNNADFKSLSIKDVINIDYKKESIHLENFDPNLQNFYTLTYRNVDTINWIDGFYITQQGDKVPMEGYGYAVLPVVEETEVIISGTRSFQAVCYLVKDAKGNVLKHDNKGTDGETVITNEKFKIPKGGVELYISKYHFKSLKIKDYIYINFIDDSIPYDALDKQIKDFCILDYRKVDNLKFTMKHYVGENGEISPIENDSFGYTVLDVKEGTDCIITGSKAWESICYLVKNDNGDVLLKDGRPEGVETKIVNEKFTIPKGGTKLFIGKYGFRELKIKDKLFAKNITSPLKDKLICFNGDSICQGLVNNGGYAKILKDQTGCKIENRAIGGGTLSANGKGYHEICNDIANMSDDANMVILEGGINDYFQAIELGEMKPLNDFTSEVDKTTVLGGLESIFRTCIDKWLGVPIIFVIVHPVSNTRFTINSKGYSFQMLADAIKKMCSKYSIALVDLLNESGGFNCNIEKIAKRYTINEGDGIHPNEEGYEIYYNPQIRMKAESLITKH